MPIEKNTVVTFHYDLSDEKGEIIESSRDSEPQVYLHGYDGILPGLANALEGKDAEDNVAVTLLPEQAYGLIKPESMQRISLKHLMGAKKWRPGMIAQVNTDQGRRHVRVVKVGHKFVDVDTNHPLAGQTLTFTIDIVSTRDADPEEIAHGHVHGAGGHHH